MGAVEHIMKDEDVVEREEVWSQRTTVSKWKPKRCTFCRLQGCATMISKFSICNTLLWLSLWSTSEDSTSWLNWDRVNYLCVQDFSWAHPGFTKVITNVPQISVDEVVYLNGLKENGWMKMLQLEQKSISLIKDLCVIFQNLAPRSWTHYRGYVLRKILSHCWKSICYFGYVRRMMVTWKFNGRACGRSRFSASKSVVRFKSCGGVDQSCLGVP